MEAREVENLDELNIQRKEDLMRIVERDEEKEKETQDKHLSVAERMMRRAQSNTFTLTFLDELNDDEIPIEFRLLYSKERRDLLKLIDEVQDLRDGETIDIDVLNEKLDELKGFVKNVTMTPGMEAYYDSEFCQDIDITQIARAVMARTVSTVEEARSFRKE